MSSADSRLQQRPKTQPGKPCPRLPTSSSLERLLRGGEKPRECDKWKGIFPWPLKLSRLYLSLAPGCRSWWQPQSGACLAFKIVSAKYQLASVPPPLYSNYVSTNIGRNEPSFRNIFRLHFSLGLLNFLSCVCNVTQHVICIWQLMFCGSEDSGVTPHTPQTCSTK